MVNGGIAPFYTRRNGTTGDVRNKGTPSSSVMHLRALDMRNEEVTESSGV